MRQPIKWCAEYEAIISDRVERARENGLSNKTAFLAASEMIHKEYDANITPKACEVRYYNIMNKGITSNAPAFSEINQSNDGEEVGNSLADMFLEMKKIIKERDELRSKYADAVTYKMMYEEIKKKLARIEKESAMFIDLLKKRG